MTLGKIIAVLGLLAVFDILIYGIAYWTGFLTLKAFTLGSARLAAFSTLFEEKRLRFHDGGSHLHQSHRLMISAGNVCLVGLLFIVLVGSLTLFLAWPKSEL